MNRYMIILGVLILILVGSQMYLSATGGMPERSWTQCKESFVQQMISGDCTPTRDIYVQPDSDAGGTSGGSDTGNDGGRLIMERAPDNN